MIWKILRPKFWILDRAVRQTDNFLITGVLFLILWGGQYVYNAYIVTLLPMLASEEALNAMATILPMGLFIFLIAAVAGTSDIIHQLYLAPDLQLLMTAPIPNRVIFLVKLLQCSPASVLPAVLFGIILILFGVVRSAPFSFYFLCLLLVLAAVFLVTALVMSLIIFLARLIPPKQVRNWLPVLLALLQIPLLLSFQSGMDWFFSQAAWITYLIEALLVPGQLAVVVVISWGGALIMILVAYQIFDHAFYGGWNQLRVVPTKTNAKKQKITRSNWLSQWTQILPAPIRAILLKEWKELKRDMRRLFSFIGMPFLFIAMIWPLLSLGDTLLKPIVFWFLMFLGFMLANTVLVDGLITFGREGRLFRLLKSMPLSMETILRGKFWGAPWSLGILVYSSFYLIIGFFMDYPLWQIAFLVGTVAWGAIGTSALAVAYGALVADFSVDDPIKQSVSILHQFIMSGALVLFIAPIFASVVWLIIQFFPESDIVVPIRVIASLSSSWLFSESIWVLIGLIGIQGLFLLGIKGLWGISVRRLERLEI